MIRKSKNKKGNSNHPSVYVVEGQILDLTETVFDGAKKTHRIVPKSAIGPKEPRNLRSPWPFVIYDVKKASRD